jgi:protein KTI12
MEIGAAMFENHPPPPHQFIAPTSAAYSFLYQLDQVMSQVLTELMEVQKNAVPGNLLTLPGTTEHLQFTYHLTMAELSHLHEQFISYTKMHSKNGNLSHLANIFLQYLNQSLH